MTQDAGGRSGSHQVGVRQNLFKIVSLEIYGIFLRLAAALQNKTAAKGHSCARILNHVLKSETAMISLALWNML